MISMEAFTYAAMQRTLLVLTPEFLILFVATAMMTAGAFVKLPRRTWSIIAAATLVASLLILIALRHTSTDVYAYSTVALNDAMSGYCRLFFLLTGLIVLGLAHDQVDDARSPEFFGSLLMINAGAMLVSSANEIVFLFVGLELVSLPTYLLLYLSRRNQDTREAATKYFFLSIFSSALLLFGLAYLYGMTGVSNLKALSYLVQYRGVPQQQFGTIAAVFVLAGLGFRVAAVPFHFYAPDVYQGSPTVIAALLAWVPKGIGFVAILRVLTFVLAGKNEIAVRAVILVWAIAAMTMLLGNVVALLQQNLRRLLAYSSIAHAGYLMIGVAVAFRDVPGASGSSYVGSQAVLIYLVFYALMTLGAFGVIIALSTPDRPVETIDDLAGLRHDHPWYALAMAICLFSLAGVPPMAGFYGKFALFSSAIGSDQIEGSQMLVWLTILGVLTSAIGAYYYLRIIVLMYLRDRPATPLEARAPWPTALAVGACASLTVFLGIYSEPIQAATREAAISAAAYPNPSLNSEPTLPAKVALKADH